MQRNLAIFLFPLSSRCRPPRPRASASPSPPAPRAEVRVVAPATPRLGTRALALARRPPRLGRWPLCRSPAAGQVWVEPAGPTKAASGCSTMAAGTGRCRRRASACPASAVVVHQAPPCPVVVVQPAPPPPRPVVVVQPAPPPPWSSIRSRSWPRLARQGQGLARQGQHKGAGASRDAAHARPAIHRDPLCRLG